MADSKSYDFVVVGGGTAGLVLANRLSANPNLTVAVIEAGGDVSADPRVLIPGLFTAASGSELDWGYTTAPQEGFCGRRITQPQGKALGGSSAINAQALIPFSSTDLDDWEGLIGNKGWNSDLLAYLGQIFSLRLPDDDTVNHLNVSWADSFAASTKGSVNASFAGIKQDPMPKAWNKTFENLGYPLTTSPFLGHSTGPYSAPSTVDAATTTRTYSANSYYLPVANRLNLTVYSHSIATRILLSEQDSTATGVVFQQENATRTIRAKKEVILSAGALNSPKLLELSGIGDPNVLQAAGLDVKVANPHVGTNLQDHPLCGISFEAALGVSTGDDLVRNDPKAMEQAMELYKNHQAQMVSSPR